MVGVGLGDAFGVVVGFRVGDETVLAVDFEVFTTNKVEFKAVNCLEIPSTFLPSLV